MDRFHSLSASILSVLLSNLSDSLTRHFFHHSPFSPFPSRQWKSTQIHTTAVDTWISETDDLVHGLVVQPHPWCLLVPPTADDSPGDRSLGTPTTTADSPFSTRPPLLPCTDCLRRRNGHTHPTNGRPQSFSGPRHFLDRSWAP